MNIMMLKALKRLCKADQHLLLQLIANVIYPPRKLTEGTIPCRAARMDHMIHR